MSSSLAGSFWLYLWLSSATRRFSVQASPHRGGKERISALRFAANFNSWVRSCGPASRAKGASLARSNISEICERCSCSLKPLRSVVFQSNAMLSEMTWNGNFMPVCRTKIVRRMSWRATTCSNAFCSLSHSSMPSNRTSACTRYKAPCVLGSSDQMCSCNGDSQKPCFSIPVLLLLTRGIRFRQADRLRLYLENFLELRLLAVLGLLRLLLFFRFAQEFQS